jgi:hypothetical protein
MVIMHIALSFRAAILRAKHTKKPLIISKMPLNFVWMKE